MYDFLAEDLIHVAVDGDVRGANLPQIFAWLSGEHEVTFAALQPHQHHPWHAFLVQLAALALARGGMTALSTDPGAWHAGLLKLTAGKREAWALVVDDLTSPALFQPPVPEGRLDGFKTSIATPDELDILLTTRNFDLKSQRMIYARPEHWLFALVTKQTFEGYSGKLNYGIARMNGGQANRPCVGVAPSLSWGPRFRRDVSVWLEHRDELIADYKYESNGHALLWLTPWDGTKSIARTSLDPFFIEACRRIRLGNAKDGITARMGTSSIARIDATDHAGATGDIWTPIQLSTKKPGRASLTIPASGFTYKKLSELLFECDEWPARKIRPEDGPAPIVIAQALVRGQGKTEGYHERIVPIPAGARKFFSARDGLQRLSERAKLRISRTAEARDRVLKPGVLTLLQGVREDKLDFRDPRGSPWLERFEQGVDDQFFTVLFNSVDESDQVSRLDWDEVLRDLVDRTFEQATREVPLPSIHRYPILAAAEGRLRGGRSRFFAELREVRGDRNRKTEAEHEEPKEREDHV